MKTIELSKFEKTRRKYGGTQPFVIYFVYPKDGEPVVVKGMYDAVEKYVKQTFPLALYRWTMWVDGGSRGGWSFTCEGRYIHRKGRRHELSVYDGNKLVRKLSFRRVPRKWIPEFDLSNDDLSSDTIVCQWCHGFRSSNPGICPHCARFPV